MPHPRSMQRQFAWGCQTLRYFRRGTGTVWSRLGSAAGQIYLTRTDSGHSRFNYSELSATQLQWRFRTLTIQVTEQPATLSPSSEFSLVLRWHRTS